MRLVLNLQQKNCHFYKFDCTNNTLFGLYFMQVVKKCNDYTGRAVEKKASKKCTLCQDYICSAQLVSVYKLLSPKRLAKFKVCLLRLKGVFETIAFLNKYQKQSRVMKQESS